MFFPKLRRRAKWVFLFLALVFGIGFVAFGVGTGVPGTSIGDVFQDFLGSRGADQGPSVEEAREKAEANARDSQAQLDLANALQREGRTREAIRALERYVALQPGDVTALRQLAVLWGTEGAAARQEAESAQAAAQRASITDSFARPDSLFVQELVGNEIAESVAELARERAAEASARAQSAAREEAAVYQELVLLEPDDENLLLQLGVASQQAGDLESAIAAYERFLELAPDNPSAPLVEEQLELLEQVRGAGGG